MSGLKYLIKMVNGDDEKIGYAEYQEIKMKEDLKKNTGKLAKTLGANAVVIALSLYCKEAKVQRLRSTRLRKMRARRHGGFGC